jgi:hypothetical protein
MALWGNKDLVYNDGSVSVNLETKQVVGTTGVTTFTNSVNIGDVITVGAGATYGYAVVSGVTSTTLSIDSTSGFVSGVTTVPSGTTYAISDEPLYTVKDVNYLAPEVQTGLSTNPVTRSVFGVDTAESQTARTANSQYRPAHAGWVGITTYIDCHGNLRVKSETLVAMGKDSAGNGGIQNDADGSILADDTQYPDS